MAMQFEFEDTNAAAVLQQGILKLLPIFSSNPENLSPTAMGRYHGLHNMPYFHAVVVPNKSHVCEVSSDVLNKCRFSAVCRFRF